MTYEEKVKGYQEKVIGLLIIILILVVVITALVIMQGLINFNNYQHEAFGQPILHGFSYGNGSLYSTAFNITQGEYCHDHFGNSIVVCHVMPANMTMVEMQ